MKWITLLVCIAATVAQRASAETKPSHAVFTALLGDNVEDGRVRYARLCEDDRLQTYTEYLSSIDPSSIAGAGDRLAFWINAYNAFTLKIVCDNYPIDSINDLHFGGLVIGTVLGKTVWDKKFISIGGEQLSLNHIEHDIIRKEFDDFRVHFALVCASTSCPPLRSEAFEGDTLDEQLDDQGRIFFRDGSNNWFDTDGRVAHLSKILDWYAGDFGPNDEEILLAVAHFLPSILAEHIREDPAAWEIKYTDYDWSLNDWAKHR